MLSSVSRLAAVAMLALTLAGCAHFPWPALGEKHLVAYQGKVDPIAARDMISKYRESHGLTAVAIDPVLERVAQGQALAMARADTMSHTIDGNLVTRLDEAGVEPSAAIENVSEGYRTLASALSGWRRSPPHDANLLNPRMRRMGIASAVAPASKYKVYWALDMTD